MWTFQDHVVQDECKRLPFPAVREHPSKSKRPLVEVRWRGETKQFAPEEVSAMVLQEMADIASEEVGREITRAVITVPPISTTSSARRRKMPGASLD